MIPATFDGCNCVDIVISRPNPKLVRSHFLSIWVNSDHGKRQVFEGQGGLAQQHFNVGEMKTSLVKVSYLGEQFHIENVLAAHNQMSDDVTTKLSKLRSLKTALMQDLLTGEVRVALLLEAKEVPA